MSEVSRRDFLKVGAAGLVVAGAGGTLLTQSVNAMTNIGPEATKALCPEAPDKPERYNGRIYCEATDFDFGREYAALIHVVNGVEIDPPELYGSFFDPFDGSSIPVSGSASPSDYYLCRSYCTNIGYQDAVEVGGGSRGMTNAEDTPLHIRNKRLMRPPTPILDERDSNSQRIEMYFEKSQEWDDQLEELLNDGVKVERVRLERYIVVGYHIDGRPKLKKIVKGSSDRDNKGNIFKSRKPGDLFNQNRKMDHNPSRAKTYAYTAEVIFDFGTVPGPRRQRCLRGVSSDLLIVDMRNMKNET